MKVVAVVQNKGGVGKTMLTRNLAVGFARRGKRVLIIDLDAQCNLSRRFLSMTYDPSDPDGVLPPVHPDFDPEAEDGWSGLSSSAEIYFSGEVFPYPTRIDGVDALPGHGSRLLEIELVKASEVRERVHERLKAFLDLPEVAATYDLVLIDTAPAKGPLTISAMRAATHLIIPTVMEQQPIEGLHGMLALWRRELRQRDVNRPLQIAAIQVNLFRRSVALHEGLYASLRENPAVSELLSPVLLCQRVAFAETDRDDARPANVFDLGLKDPARIEATAMVDHIDRTLYGTIAEAAA
jgi:chromosome partitioning protein